ncbi:proteasome, subunit alpha/beta, partial [Kipferlia bialata]
VPSKLLDASELEKCYQLDKHIVAAIAGITADANILISEARVAAQRWLYTFDTPIPVKQL